MNILGLIFSLLLILAFGFQVCWEKQINSNRILSTFISHEKANRSILNSYQSEIYEQLRVRKNPIEQKEEDDDDESPLEMQKKQKKIGLNQACAKINIYPLIQEGREKHRLLYEMTAKLIRTFYSPLQKKKKRFEYYFLDQLLSAAKTTHAETPLAIEKIDFEDPDLQKLFYRMLKGTKKWDLGAAIGYPPLLDYIKVEPSQDKICIFHAHPDLIAALFNMHIAKKLYGEIHQQNGPLLTRELIEQVCSEFHQISVDPDLFELLELGKPYHEENKKAFVAQSNDVILRKNIIINSAGK